MTSAQNQITMLIAILTISFLLNSVLSPSITYADSWDITQIVHIDDAIRLEQSNNNDSTQAINRINSNDIASTYQSVDLNNSSVTLQQIDSDQSQQALNLLSSEQIQDAIQSSTGISTLDLRQNGGDANRQAVNILESQGTVSGSQQLSADVVNFNQISGKDNIQAGNIGIGIQGDLTQNFTAKQVNIRIDNADGNAPIQAANYINRSLLNTLSF
jgi:hypothetical protein